MSEEENERLNEEAERANRIRDYVPEEEFDLTAAQGESHISKSHRIATTGNEKSF